MKLHDRLAGSANGAAKPAPAPGVRPITDYLTPRQAAAMIGVSSASVCRWIRQGRLRGYKLAGALILIDPDDLKDVIAPVVPRP